MHKKSSLEVSLVGVIIRRREDRLGHPKFAVVGHFVAVADVLVKYQQTAESMVRFLGGGWSLPLNSFHELLMRPFEFLEDLAILGGSLGFCFIKTSCQQRPIR